MKGKHKIVVKNNRLHYEFEIKRNITIIKGDSATGKTTLINMIRQFANLGNASGIEIECDAPCTVLEGNLWQMLLKNLSGNIIFIDEENQFIRQQEFAELVKASDNYFVIITRKICTICHIVLKKYMDCILQESIRTQSKYIRRCIIFIL